MEGFKGKIFFSTLIAIIILIVFSLFQSARALTFSDQGTVALTGDVKSTISLFTMTKYLNANSAIFGSNFGISPTLVTTASPNIILTILTNNPHGYVVTIKDEGDGQNPGLYDPKAKFLIGSADFNYNDTIDLSKHPGYGVQASSAQSEIASRYNQSGDNVGGYERIPENLASYSGPANYHIITLVHKARASGNTPTGAYSDTITIIAVPNY